MADLSCGGSCIKLMLFVANIVVFLTGAVLLGVGIWAKVDPGITQYIEVLSIDQNDPLWHSATVLVIAVGAFIFVVGFLGCCGACKESPCMLWMYIAFLIIIFVAEIAAAVLAIVFRRDLFSALDKTLSKQAQSKVVDKYKDVDPLNLAWHAMQVNLKCCGGHSYMDFWENTNFNKNTNPVPKTCCRLRPGTNDPMNPTPENLVGCYSEAKTTNATNTNQLYSDNCTDALEEWLSSKAVVLVAIAFSVAIIQILAMVLACCLRKEILDDK